MRIKKAVIVGATSAAALGAGLGVASYATAAPTTSPSPSGSPSASASQTPGTDQERRGGRGGFFRGELVSQLAEKLGVEESRVTTALQEIREERRDSNATPGPGSQADRDAREAELAQALAEKLGVEQARVQTALDEIQAERQAERAEALQERLDQAVQDGTLTQAEADAVKKAVEAGVIGGHGRR